MCVPRAKHTNVRSRSRNWVPSAISVAVRLKADCVLERCPAGRADEKYLFCGVHHWNSSQEPGSLSFSVVTAQMSGEGMGKVCSVIRFMSRLHPRQLDAVCCL